MRSIFTTVVALLPAIALAAPSGTTCTPTDTFLAAGAKVVSQSSLPSYFWDAIPDTPKNTFIGVQDLPGSDVIPATQTWNIKAVNGGFAFQNGAYTGNNSQCLQGDTGGPVDSVACPDFDNGSVPEFAVWTITCNNGCGDNFALGCSIQSKNEGECAEASPLADGAIVLEDCDSTVDAQVLDIALA